MSRRSNMLSRSFIFARCPHVRCGSDARLAHHQMYFLLLISHCIEWLRG